VAAAGELGHGALGVHAAGEHVAVVAIAGDDLVARRERQRHADHDRFLNEVASRSFISEEEGVYSRKP
jgi:hypothetical protein